MVDASAPLSGSGPQEVWVRHHRVGQDQAGNFSQFYVEVRYYGNGWGSWTNSTLFWSAHVSGWSVAGSFTIPQARRNDTYTVLFAGFYNRAHDAAGNLDAFNGHASIDGSVHASIGSGTAHFTEPASPRIPKRPSPPPFSIDNIEADSFRVLVEASADHGGSPVQGYLIRVSTNPQADTPGTYVDHFGPGTQTITGQTPGTTRHVTVYGMNGAADNSGFSNYQASQSVTLPVGVYVSDGSAWRAQGLNASNGSAWTSLVPQISSGVRRNLVTDPRATNAALWSFAGAASASETMVTGATDGPVLPDGTRVTTYARYTVTTTGSSFAVGHLVASPVGAALPQGTPVAVSIYVRANASGNVRARLNRDFDLNLSNGPNIPLVAGAWKSIGSILTTNIDSVTELGAGVLLVDDPLRAVGAIIDVTCAMIEPGATEVGPYLDDQMASGAVWQGPANV